MQITYEIARYYNPENQFAFSVWIMAFWVVMPSAFQKNVSHLQG
jgi:hypothetical protein